MSRSKITGADHAPGVVEGGVLSQGAVEINIEALPGHIPDALHLDVSGMEMNDNRSRSPSSSRRPAVTLLDDPHETVLATVTPPTKEPEPEEIETETGLVGEGEDAEGEAAAAQAEGDTGEEGRAVGLRRVLRLKLFSSVLVDWLVVGLGNPGQPLRRHAPQRRFPGRRRTDRSLGPAEAEAQVRRRAERRASRPRRAARGGAASPRPT